MGLLEEILECEKEGISITGPCYKKNMDAYELQLDLGKFRIFGAVNPLNISKDLPFDDAVCRVIKQMRLSLVSRVGTDKNGLRSYE